MDTKLKNFSHSMLLKLLAVLLILSAVGLAAYTVVDVVNRAEQQDYTPTLANSYDENDAIFWNSMNFQNRAIELAGELKSEEYIKSGANITSDQLRSLWYDFADYSSFRQYINRLLQNPAISQSEKENLESMDYGAWEDEFRYVLEESEFSLQPEEVTGDLKIVRQGPSFSTLSQAFFEQQTNQLNKRAQKLIQWQLSLYREYQYEMQAEPNVRYYTKIGDTVVTNVKENEIDQWKNAPIYYAIEQQKFFSKLGGSSIEGSWVGDHWRTTASNSTLNNRSYRHENYISGMGGLDEGDVSYVWFTQEYVTPLQQVVETNRQLTVRYIWIFGSCLVAFLISLVYLICTCGRRSKGEPVQLIWVDKIFFEINLALWWGFGIIGGWTLYFAFYYRQNWLCWATVPLAGLMLGLFLSIVRLLKARKFRHSFLCWRLVCWLALPFRKTVAGLRKLSQRTPLVKRSVWLMALYGSLCLLCFIIFPVSIALIIAASILAFHLATDFQAVVDGVRQIKNGDLNHKIYVKKSGPIQDLAMDINSITDGLNAAVENELRSERMKSELITNVSHDIRTPLTSIITYVDLIQKEGTGSENAQQYFEVISQKALRLKDLTDSLFEVSKAASGNIKVEFADVDMADLLRQGLGELSDKIDASGLDFRVQLPKTLWVRADGKLLWRVIENLVSNVFKYALAGSRVYIELEDLGEKAQFTIKNISAYELNVDAKFLTERFQRGDASRHSDGNGLGLAIAKSLVENQRGSFTVSVDGDLFKATVQLPRVQAPETIHQPEPPQQTPESL